ncbi:MAG: amidohydrolase family protein [Alphaproteobacteria bacterium]|nr:amidohydrolase family protein [Alphaproteobacteria bacterium]
MKIIDAHHHFWDLTRNPHPWLTDEGRIPFRYGDYSAICRDYLLPDYRRDTKEFDIVGSVHIEAEWDPDDPVGETAWLAHIRSAHGLPSVCVAQAWLHHDDVETVLSRHASFPFVRAVRHKPPEPAGSMEDMRWRGGYALLDRYGLSFDLQTPWTRLEEAYGLARDFPNIQIVLNHTGLPADRSAEGLEGWRAAMRRFALAPNVAVKISGIGTPSVAWTAADNREIVLATIDIFGVERCMFASNFPVDSLVATYTQIFSGFIEIVADFSQGEREKLFHDNAARYYRISE